MPGQRPNQLKKVVNQEKQDKRIYIDLSKEYEEDKELIELLEGKRKNIFIIIIYLIIASTSQFNVRKKIIDDEDNKNKKYKIKQKNDIENMMKENDLINNDSNIIFKKIENYDINKYNNNNNNIQIKINKDKDKEKEKTKITNIQKNTFLNNNFNKYNHVSRMINLKSLNSHNHNNLNNLKETLFTKYNKIGGINHNQIKDPFKKEQKCISAFDSMLASTKNNTEELNNLQNLNKNMVYNQKKNIKNYNFNDDTPSASTLAYSKKYNSNSTNNQNMTEDHNNKFRMGLLSAFSNSNNNIIIPIIPIQRPLSNFNLGGGQLWENIENLNKNTVNSVKIEQNNKQLNMNKKLINNINIIEKNKICNDMRNKIGTAPGQKRNEFNYFFNNDKEKNIINKNYSNIFANMNNFGPKFHHIKIDRSLMNNKFADSLNKNMFLNYMSLEQNHLPKIKNNNFNEIKKLSYMRNNSTKN